MSSETAARVEARLLALGVAAPEGFIAQASAYYDLLFRWNRTVNLTALRDGVEAIDRLIVEPLTAAPGLAADAVLVDVGSGGGSPAVPLKLAMPGIDLTMIEARGRKGAFLREVLRALQVGGARVEVSRVEDWATSGRIKGPAVVSMRAVRLDPPLASALWWATAPGTQLWYFGTEEGAGAVPGWSRLGVRILLPSRGSALTTYRREDAVHLPTG